MASADRLIEVFTAAKAMPAGRQRDRFLVEACREDPALREQIVSLLQAHEDAGHFLDPPTAPAQPVLPTEKPGDKIGRYKLLQQIGEGGCGVVYMAEQEEPVRRRVALKVIKLGMDTKSVIARFEAERQALAMMDHPSIAKVLDAGATDTGRPYFVMELVRGSRITGHCDENNLSTRERLRLFIQVCHAIQHAHQKGIIHRDIKPSNILVTVNEPGAPGIPKVIDFGIAKATAGERLTDKTIFTAFEQFMGTPAYMSPEQAVMTTLDVDTRTDIYALGVLLYELLTGETPFNARDLMASGFDAMRWTIREEEPACPSTRVSTMLAADLRTLARRRRSDAPRLVDQLRGDLDWIVMKCLEKDRSRRYETAGSVATDIQRHLDDEPILARPPGRIYRFRKLVRRNRTMVAAIVMVTLALIAGLAASVSQAMRAHRGEARAHAALADLRASAPAFAAEARGLVAQGQFARAIEKLEYAIKLQPDNPEYLLAKANLLRCQFRFAEAAPLYRAALHIDPNAAGALTNAALCEQLHSLGNTPSRWRNDTMAALFVVMTREQRSAAELRTITAHVLENSRQRLANAFAGHALDKRLTVLPNGGLLSLDLKGMPFFDSHLLQGLPLSKVDASYCAIADLHPFEALPLTGLNLAGATALDFTPLRSLRGLQNISLEFAAIVDLAPLQGLPLYWLDLNGTRVSDLSALRGQRLHTLRIRNTRVTDLSPLAGMPLRELDCTSIPARNFSSISNCTELMEAYFSNTALSSLEALRNCKLVNVRFDGTAVRDLSPLAGMPLKSVRFHNTAVTDVTPLLQCPALEEIGLPRGAVNVTRLRALPNLRRISFDHDTRGEPAQTAPEFWNAWDRREL